MLSTHSLYILSSKDVSKKVPIAELKYIVKSMLSKELLLYFDSDFDMRLVFESRDEMLNLLKLRFAKFCPKKHLKVYGIPEESLKKYKASKQRGSMKGYAFDCEPPSKFRLQQEEIQTQREVDEIKKKGLMESNIDIVDIDIDPNDFEFGGWDSYVVIGKKKGLGEEMKPS